MKKYKMGILALCLTVVMLSIGLIATVTYAVFSGKVETTNHLEAGTLNIELYRTKLETYSLIDDGTMDNYPVNSERKSFTSANSDNVFGLDKNAKIAPESKFTATMEIVNAGKTGDVAFTYWIEIKLPANIDANALAKQLRVTVTPEAGEAKTQYLSEGLVVNNLGVVVHIGETATFTVEITFENGIFSEIDEETGEQRFSTNNTAKNQQLDFDLIVHALQSVE